MPAWLISFLAPLIEAIATAVVREWFAALRRETIPEVTDDPRDAVLLGRLRDLVERMPPAEAPRKP